MEPMEPLLDPPLLRTVGESLLGVTSQLLIIESVPGANYQNVKEIFSKSISNIKPSLPTLTKKEVKGLLELAESDHERECIRVAIHKASGLSQSGSRQHFGFEQMTKRAAKVDDCIKESLEIRRACHQLAEIQVQALSITSNSDEDQDVDEVPASSTRVVVSGCQ